jgi:hypothetical protein
MPKKPKDNIEELRALFGRKWSGKDFEKVMGLAADHHREMETRPRRARKAKAKTSAKKTAKRR